jgi:hypothetical protein
MGVQQNVSKGGHVSKGARDGTSHARGAKGGGSDVMRTGKNAMHGLGETGERDENYALVSVLYHALQGAETYGKYIADAERARDDELVEFLTECRDEERERAQRARTMLGARIGGVGLAGGFESDSEEEE